MHDNNSTQSLVLNYNYQLPPRHEEYICPRLKYCVNTPKNRFNSAVGVNTKYKKVDDFRDFIGW